MRRYVVVQVGCIECGVSSYPIGSFDDLDDAVLARDGHPDTWETEGGEGYTVIYDMLELKEV